MLENNARRLAHIVLTLRSERERESEGDLRRNTLTTGYVPPPINQQRNNLQERDVISVSMATIRM